MEIIQSPREYEIHRHNTRISQLLGRQPWELEQSKREGRNLFELQELHAGEFEYVQRQFEALGENDSADSAGRHAAYVRNNQAYLEITEPPIENRKIVRSWE